MSDGPKPFEHGGDLEKMRQEMAKDLEKMRREACRGQAWPELIDFSSNINPLGPSPRAPTLASFSQEEISRYPDPESHKLIEAASKRFGVAPDSIIAGNGSSELFFLFTQYFARQEKIKRALILAPSYSDYERASQAAGLEIEFLYLKEEAGFSVDLDELSQSLQGSEIVFIGNPNNPTGISPDGQKLKELITENPETLFFIDEAFRSFEPEGLSMIQNQMPQNLVVFHSLTKFYAIAGLRAGLAFASPGVIAEVKKIQPGWPLNIVACEIASASLQDQEFEIGSQEYVKKARIELATMIDQTGLFKLYPSEANYLFLRCKAPHDQNFWYEHLLKEGVAIRRCSNYPGLDESFIRVAVKTNAQNQKLVEAMRKIVSSGEKSTDEKSDQGQAPVAKKREGQSAHQREDEPLPKNAPETSENFQKKKTPALMIGGASSHAGKTLLTAALCRILSQDGFRVRPFKAQNMSLNSYVTPHGEEVSRAQTLQARAAGVEVDVRMNPVLLKPMGGASDVVVLGRSTGRVDFHTYKKRRDEIFAKVCEAYDSLSFDADVMILEGAGSLAEINLKKNDIVNMKMAEYADAQVLLVADIDRGGIFASLSGTLDLLSPPERERIVGLVVNKFRGDQTLFQEGVEFLESRSKKPVAGVIPFLHIEGLPEEDSLGIDQLGAPRKESAAAQADSGVDFESKNQTTASPGTNGELSASNNSDAPGKRLPSLNHDHISIGVVRLPHVSNYTDFDALLQEGDVRAEYIEGVNLDGYDLIILPGSRNVIADMKWLKEKKLDEALTRFAASGGFITGICGGYQLCGQKIFDPHQVETGGEAIDALGLLEIETTLEKEKQLVRFEGRHTASGCEITGYEIHHGVTRACVQSERLQGAQTHRAGEKDGGKISAALVDAPPANIESGQANRGQGGGSLQIAMVRTGDLKNPASDAPADEGALIGAANASGRVWGAYIHGVFDNDEFRRWYLNEIRAAKGLTPVEKPAMWSLDEKIDELADAVRESIDMGLIYRALR